MCQIAGIYIIWYLVYLILFDVKYHKRNTCVPKESANCVILRVTKLCCPTNGNDLQSEADLLSTARASREKYAKPKIVLPLFIEYCLGKQTKGERYLP